MCSARKVQNICALTLKTSTCQQHWIIMSIWKSRRHYSRSGSKHNTIWTLTREMALYRQVFWQTNYCENGSNRMDITNVSTPQACGVTQQDQLRSPSGSTILESNTWVKSMQTIQSIVWKRKHINSRKIGPGTYTAAFCSDGITRHKNWIFSMPRYIKKQ